MQIKDLHFRPFISETELQAIVSTLAAQISRDYQERELVVCPILTGAFMFATDLVRHLAIPCRMAFERYDSYSCLASTGEAECH